MDNIIIYNTEDGQSNVRLYAKDGTVWMTQAQMAELFQCTRSNVNLHLQAIYREGELIEQATCKEFLQVRKEGLREVQRKISFYSLDAILAVGFRVRSPRGTQFRRWANTTLKEYMQKGFVIDDDRLKNPDGRPDYFDELLERIRDIRASEKRFYQKLRDLFALADVVISRAGANAICELLALRKPNLLIPLSARASRGDQILNAHSFERQGFSLVIEEEQLTNATLLDAVHNLYENREQFINAMHNSGQQDPIATIIGLIEEAAAK